MAAPRALAAMVRDAELRSAPLHEDRGKPRNRNNTRTGLTLMSADRRPILLANARIPHAPRVAEPAEIVLLPAGGSGALRVAPTGLTNATATRPASTYAPDFAALALHPTEETHRVAAGVMREGESASRLGLRGSPKA